VACELSAAPVAARADLVERTLFYAPSVFSYLFLDWPVFITFANRKGFVESELVLILLCFRPFIFFTKFPRPVLSKYGFLI
jgi:hypothetical protein